VQHVPGPNPAPAAHPHAARSAIGAALYALFMVAGAGMLAYLFVIAPLSADHAAARLEAMAVGALFAFPPLCVYLWIPRLLDRFDPEPWWCLLLALLWGGIAAAGISALVNTQASEITAAAMGGGKQGEAAGEIVAACLSAPLVEELLKGVFVLGLFLFLRREFDGVVDGIIYGTFVALGFAAVENVIYYSRAELAETLANRHGALTAAFVMRGILSPWGHPLYTSMTGAGVGLARETSKAWLKWLAPVFGYLFAALLHAIWNGAATASGMLVVLMLPLWLLFLFAFLAIIVGLVIRKGRIIRSNLIDEVHAGWLSPHELDLICSPFASLRARLSSGGPLARSFVAHGARLGLCKWHAARAMKNKTETISIGMIAPLRQELARLRGEMQMQLARRAPPPGWQGR
jgi:RsiW-degrading membrane proteinase PrsW (M82 family)